MRRLHRGRRQLDTTTDLVAEATRNVPAHERADGIADCLIDEALLRISKFRVETLGITDRELALVLVRDVEELIGLVERQRKRLLEKNVLSSLQRFLGHWVMGGLGRR